MAKGCTVYVGNIDFDIPEQKVIEELSKIGRVVNFRMMIDKQTGKSKGYGFCEYETPLIAETAVQKLKITLNSRQLKINYADIDTAAPQIPKKESEIPIDDLIDVINKMDKNNLKEVLFYLKGMAVDQPRKLKKILDENQNLGIALFQCFIELGIVEKENVYEMLKKNFNIDDNQVQIFERICGINEDELETFDDDVKDKIKQIKKEFVKK